MVKLVGGYFTGRLRVRQSFSPKLRKQILNRDGSRCQVCHSTEDLEIDHCLPVCLGGNNNPLNLRVLCRICNVKRNSDIKRYRTKRVKEHVKKMELDKDRLLKAGVTEIERLQREIRLKEKELVWEKDRNTEKQDYIQWLQERIDEYLDIIRIDNSTMLLMQKRI